jgi:phosphate-selective porin OprO/OprP
MTAPAWAVPGTPLRQAIALLAGVGCAAACLAAVPAASPPRSSALAAPPAGPYPPAGSISETPPSWTTGARLQLDHVRLQGVLTRDGQRVAERFVRRAEVDAELRWRPSWRAVLTLGSDGRGQREVSDAYVGFTPQAGSEWRLGRLDPDVGLDPSTSTSWTFAIERSAIWDLAPEAASAAGGGGLRVDTHGPGWLASAGVYDKRDHGAAAGRAVWLPDVGAGQILQLGASASLARGRADSGRLRSRLTVRGVTEDPNGRRPELAAAAPAGLTYARDDLLAVEAAWQSGRLQLQGEALWRHLHGPAGGTAAPSSRRAEGHTVLAAWALQGPARRHEARRGRFGRPDGAPSTLGHWEAFARHDALRADGQARARAWTVGVSWTAGRHWRVMVNAHQVQASDSNRSGDRRGRALSVRLQAVF